MISYHPRKCDFHEAAYAQGFQVMNTNGTARVAVIMERYVWSPIIWRNGHRLNENFIKADWVALDFDEGMSLAEARENVFCDAQCIIGTTKSHLKPKNGVIQDRFRVVIKLEQPITSKKAYAAKVRKFVKEYNCDPACTDGARFFWPCKDIVLVQPNGYTEEVSPETDDEPTKYTAEYIMNSQAKFLRTGGIEGLEGWLREFIQKGTIPEWSAGRNHTCYRAALKLLTKGLSPDDVIDILIKAPFSKEKFTDREVETTVDSAFTWLKKELEKGH